MGLINTIRPNYFFADTRTALLVSLNSWRLYGSALSFLLLSSASAGCIVDADVAPPLAALMLQAASLILTTIALPSVEEEISRRASDER
jgi:hypothetical protein